jgi:hypothetical protein
MSGQSAISRAGEVMNQYIINEEKLCEIYNSQSKTILKRVVKEIRSHPYQSDRDKVLDELVEWRIEYMKTRGRGFAEYLAAEGRKIAELRQQAGEP